MCAGVQKVSRPIVRCQEMSHNIPMAMLVPPSRTVQTYAGTLAGLAVSTWLDFAELWLNGMIAEVSDTKNSSPAVQLVKKAE